MELVKQLSERFLFLFLFFSSFSMPATRFLSKRLTFFHEKTESWTKLRASRGRIVGATRTPRRYGTRRGVVESDRGARRRRREAQRAVAPSQTNGANSDKRKAVLNWENGLNWECSRATMEPIQAREDDRLQDRWDLSPTPAWTRTWTTMRKLLCFCLWKERVNLFRLQGENKGKSTVRRLATNSNCSYCKLKIKKKQARKWIHFVYKGKVRFVV